MSGGASYGQSSQNAGSSSSQNVWQPQAGYLQDLYAQGSQLAGSAPTVPFNPNVGAAWNSALSGQINPSTGEVIDNATRDLGLDFQRNVMPSLRRSAVGAGAAGGGREGIAQGLAAGEAVRAMASTRASMTNDALNRAQGAQTAALGLSPSLMTTQAGLPWENLTRFAQLLGSPVVLGQSSSSSSGRSFDVGTKASSTGKG